MHIYAELDGGFRGQFGLSLRNLPLSQVEAIPSGAYPVVNHKRVGDCFTKTVRNDKSKLAFF